jgi:hypothetical protein
LGWGQGSGAAPVTSTISAICTERLVARRPKPAVRAERPSRSTVLVAWLGVGLGSGSTPLGLGPGLGARPRSRALPAELGLGSGLGLGLGWVWVKG